MLHGMDWNPAILWECFHSGDLYRRVAREWKGLGLFVLLAFTLGSVVIAAVRTHVEVGKWCSQHGPQLTAQIPTLLIENGEASTAEPGPFEITEPESGELLAIVNTEVDAPPADLGGALMYLSRTSLTVKNNETEKRVYELDEVEQYVLDPEIASGYLGWIESWLALILLPFLFLGFGLVRIIQWLFFSLMALAAKSLGRINLSYRQLLRLTAVAMMPALWVDLIRDMAGAVIPLFGIVFITMIVIYVNFAVRANQG